jgi:predicted Zn finger-like uncharacterized protein
VVVQCPSCQSKFRIAGDKVTDKGVRVRCSSCKNVFQARRPGAGAQPGTAPGTTTDLTSLAASPVGRAPSRVPAAVRPPSSSHAPAARSSARASESAARRLDADDLFGMAELTGDAPLAPVSLSAPVTKPISKPEAAFGDLDLDFSTSETPAVAPSLPPPPPQPDEAEDGDPPKEEQHSAEPAAGEVNGVGPAREDSFELAFGKPQPAPAASAKAPEPARPARAAAPEPARPARAAAPAPPGEPEAPAGRMLASVLTGLLGAALVIAVVIASALSGRAAGWLGFAPSADVVATRVVSGLYDTAGGKPVFYVRGRVENRGAKVHGRVRVTAELVAEGASPATAETTAGAEPSAEDVWSLRTVADAERLGRNLELASADRRLQPGGSLPFFAIIADPPADLRRHHLQISLETMDASKPSAATRPGAKDK